MKNFKKIYIQPDIYIHANFEDVMSSSLGIGNYNINWLVPEEEEKSLWLKAKINF